MGAGLLAIRATRSFNYSEVMPSRASPLPPKRLALPALRPPVKPEERIKLVLRGVCFCDCCVAVAHQTGRSLVLLVNCYRCKRNPGVNSIAAVDRSLARLVNDYMGYYFFSPWLMPNMNSSKSWSGRVATAALTTRGNGQ